MKIEEFTVDGSDDKFLCSIIVSQKNETPSFISHLVIQSLITTDDGYLLMHCPSTDNCSLGAGEEKILDLGFRCEKAMIRGAKSVNFRAALKLIETKLIALGEISVPAEDNSAFRFHNIVNLGSEQIEIRAIGCISPTKKTSDVELNILLASKHPFIANIDTLSVTLISKAGDEIEVAKPNVFPCGDGLYSYTVSCCGVQNKLLAGAKVIFALAVPTEVAEFSMSEALTIPDNS